MILTNQDIEKYKDIYYKEYGVVLSDEEALEQGNKLVYLFELLMKDK